jgi:hypothetical protein
MRPVLYRGPVGARHDSSPFPTSELFHGQKRRVIGAPAAPFSFSYFFSTFFLCA